MTTLKFLLRNHPFALSVFVLGAVVALYFAGRLVLGFIYFNDPRHQNQALEPWMTPSYVGMSYRIPREKVREVLGITPDHGRITMGRIAAERDMSMEQLQSEIEAAAAALKRSKGDR